MQPSMDSGTITWETPSYLNRNVADNFDPEAFQSDHFAGMIRQQPDLSQPEVGKNLRPDSTFVLRLPLTFFSGVKVLLVGNHVPKTAAIMFDPVSQASLVQVYDHTGSFPRDLSHRATEALPTGALQGPENVTERAMRVHPGQHDLAAFDVANG